MPIVKVLTTTWVCAFCPRSLTHVAGTSAPLADEYLEAHGWRPITSEAGTDVVCDRCRPILGLLTGELTAALNRAGATA